MQAKLEISELAYLLHAVGAHKVVGLPNGRIFPQDPAAQTALLGAGFAALQEHGWLVPDEQGGLRSPAQLMLLTAVMATPQAVLSVNHFLAGTGKQIITYYHAADMWLEQFLTAEEEYLLTALPGLAEITARLRYALQIPDAPAQADPIPLGREQVELVLAQARQEDALPAAPLSLTPAGEPERAAQAAATGHDFALVALLESAALAGQQVQAFQECALLRGPENAMWAVAPTATGPGVLQPLGEDAFAALVRRLWPAAAGA